MSDAFVGVHALQVDMYVCQLLMAGLSNKYRKG